jgi:hypothetical protein
MVDLAWNLQAHVLHSVVDYRRWLGEVLISEVLSVTA